MPKELNNLEYFNGIEINLGSYFDIIEGNSNLLQTNGFYRIIRNAISHVNYKVTPDNKTIRLWNMNDVKNVEVETDLIRLSSFGVEIAKFCYKKGFKK